MNSHHCACKSRMGRIYADGVLFQSAQVDDLHCELLNCWWQQSKNPEAFWISISERTLACSLPRSLCSAAHLHRTKGCTNQTRDHLLGSNNTFLFSTYSLVYIPCLCPADHNKEQVQQAGQVVSRVIPSRTPHRSLEHSSAPCSGATWRALWRGAGIRERRTNRTHGQLLKKNLNIGVGTC